MPVRKNYFELLTKQSKKDNAICFSINKINLDILNWNRVTSTMRCDFICHCKEIGNKSISNILKQSGLFCKKCIDKKRSIKMKATCLERYGVDNTLMYTKKKSEFYNKITQDYIQKLKIANDFRNKSCNINIIFPKDGIWICQDKGCLNQRPIVDGINKFKRTGKYFLSEFKYHQHCQSTGHTSTNNINESAQILMNKSFIEKCNLISNKYMFYKDRIPLLENIINMLIKQDMCSFYKNEDLTYFTII